MIKNISGKVLPIPFSNIKPLNITCTIITIIPSYDVLSSYSFLMNQQ